MTEPMSAVEIEDVLSSIRRLVSEELRPIQRNGPRAALAEPAAAIAPAARASDTRLLLTPALRVVSQEVEAFGQTARVVSRVADALPEEGFEPETGDASLDLDAGEAPTAPFSAVDWDDDDPVEVEYSAAGPTDFASALHLDGALAGLSGEVLDPEVETAEGISGDLPADPAWEQEGPAEEAAMVIEARDDAMAEVPGADVLVDTGSDDHQMDAQEDAPESGPHWADLAEAEVMAALGVDQGREIPAAPVSERQFEEDVLRDLVRDLIREELQGDLGERITRNVRKLVRMEVARALAIHDLE